MLRQSICRNNFAGICHNNVSCRVRHSRFCWFLHLLKSTTASTPRNDYCFRARIEAMKCYKNTIFRVKSCTTLNCLSCGHDQSRFSTMLKRVSHKFFVCVKLLSWNIQRIIVIEATLSIYGWYFARFSQPNALQCAYFAAIWVNHIIQCWKICYSSPNSFSLSVR